jgi:hypothetical protein
MKHWFEKKSVALVGNAMSLFDLPYGNEIDSHDVVVRLNKAAMLINRFDAEKSHGKRTDVWIFWSVNEYKKHFNDHPNILKMHAGHQFRNNATLSLADFVYPMELYEPLKKKAGPKRNPTTGFIAIDYILNCDPSKLSVYGFDWKKTPTHTDPNRFAEKRCPHDHEVEEEYCMNAIFTRPNVFLRNDKYLETIE